jgi:hypothetical protein
MLAILMWAIIRLIVAATALGAQQPQSLESAERMRLALERQLSPFISPLQPLWMPPEIKRLGPFRLVPPDASSGAVVRVVVPVGDFAARAAHAFMSAQQRRAERKAHDDVLRELEAFRAQERSRQ